ncbi:MAG: response regulator [Firmicutes bacterium]|nr:response regulator [Bacillota bacterium]
MSKVLVVDDEAPIRNMIKRWLKDLDLEVTTSEDGETALKLVNSNNFDLVILDIAMPRLDGWEVCRRIKSNNKTKDMSVIFLTAKTEPEDKVNGFKMGADDYITKPFDKNEFIERVKLRLIKVAEKKSFQNKMQRLNVLYQIGALAHSSLNIEELVPSVVTIISNNFPAEEVAIFIRDQESQEMTLSGHKGSFAEKSLNLLGQFISDKVLDEMKHLIAESVNDIPMFSRLKFEDKDFMRNMISIPLGRSYESLGTLDLYNLPESSIRDRDFIDDILRVGEEVSRVLDLSFKFCKVHKDLEIAVNEVSALYEISDALSSTLNLEKLLNLIVKNAITTFDAQVVSLMMIDRETSELTIRNAEGLPEDVIKTTRIKLGDGIAGRVAKTGQPLLLVDVMGLERESIDVERNIKSALSVPMKIKDEVIGVLNVSKTSRYKFSETDLKQLYNLASLAAQAIEKAALYQDVKDALGEMQATYMSTVKSLSQAVDEKDSYTHGHIDRVTKYGLAIAMELDPNLLNDDMFRYALVLHDVGKIHVKDEILMKPGPLTPEEMEVMKKHPEAGARIISPIKFLKQAVDSVKYHQERYDGRGYPEGLAGPNIPLVARIIAVADAFDAMTSDRPYRKAFDIERASEEIKKNSGLQFDPAVVNAFVSAVQKKLIP